MCLTFGSYTLYCYYMNQKEKRKQKITELEQNIKMKVDCILSSVKEIDILCNDVITQENVAKASNQNKLSLFRDLEHLHFFLDSNLTILSSHIALRNKKK